MTIHLHSQSDRVPKMGVVKTASESILEETVMPSEEANYSQQGYAGKGVNFFFLVLLNHARS